MGTLVLIYKNVSPTNKYLLQRIKNVFLGSEGKFRLVEIKTAKGILKRGISKIALLPQHIFES